MRKKTKSFIKILILGWLILIVAIILNILANLLHLNTWYELIQSFSKLGIIKTIKQEPFLSIIFQFIIYPYLLGFAAHKFNRLLSKLF